MIEKILEKFRKERDLTTGSISKAICVLAIPMIVSNMLHAAFNVVDMIWVGRLGSEALAAVAMSGTILMIVMFVMIGIGIGTTAMVARFVGARNFSAADEVAMQSLIMGFFLSFVFAIVGYFISPSILRLLGATPELVNLGSGYMQIFFLGVIVMFYMFLISAILQGAGDAATPMLVLGFAIILNFILDPLMIFGIGPFPKLGVNGAAWATVISEAIGSAIALDILLRGRSRVHVRLKQLKVDFSVMWRILKIGIPASTQMLLRGFMGLVLMAIVAGFGTYAIAAYGVGMRITMLAMMPGFALGGAAAALVGQNLGAQKAERAVASAWTTVGYYSIFMFLVTLVYLFFAPNIIMLFNNQGEVVRIGSDFLRIIAVGNLFIAVGLILGRAVAGAGDTFHPMIFTFLALWLVQIPLAFFLSRIPTLGLIGVWIAILVAHLVMVCLNTTWFQMGRWKVKKV